MFDAFIQGFFAVLQWNPFLYMLIGCGIGFLVGILPGIGGSATLALMIPFIYKMTPQEAFPFLLGMHSVVSTTGDITSVLFGIPGEATTVATVVDGYPMAKKGEAGRALGAALMSSLVGALIGAGIPGHFYPHCSSPCPGLRFSGNVHGDPSGADLYCDPEWRGEARFPARNAERRIRLSVLPCGPGTPGGNHPFHPWTALPVERASSHSGGGRTLCHPGGHRPLRSRARLSQAMSPLAI